MTLIDRITFALVLVLAANSFSFAQDTIITDSGLKYILQKEGREEGHPKPGDEVKVHYEGRFEDGKIFDSSKGFSFTIGKREVIPGWEEAVQLMSEKEEAEFYIPSELAYGSRGVKDPYNSSKWVIPPDEDLIFTIRLVKIKKK